MRAAFLQSHPVSTLVPGCHHPLILPRRKALSAARAMGKRKVKDEEADDVVELDINTDSSDEYVAPAAKQRKTPTKKADGKKSPAKKREPPRRKVTETQTGDDGWTLKPPSLVYKCAGMTIPCISCISSTCTHACQTGSKLRTRH